MKKIIFFTSSNIVTDARILRAMKSVKSRLNQVEVIGIGLYNRSETHKSNSNDGLILKSNNLIFDAPFLPHAVRRVINLIEMNIKFLYYLFNFQPHIAHVNDYHPLPATLVYRFFKKIRIIYDAHELESNKGGLGAFSSKLIFALEKRAWKHVSLFINPSYSATEWYMNIFGRIPNLVIYNTPEKKYFDGNLNRDYLRSKFGIPEDRLIFIYVGILNYGRGIDLLLNTFKNNEVNSHCVFLGYGPISDLIKERSISNFKIHYHEPVPHEEVTSLISSADVGLAMIENISLSAYFCAPNKLFEYAFSDLYVVASDLPEMSRLITKHNLGDLISDEPESLLNKVKELEQKDSLKIDRVNLYELSWEYQSDLLIDAYRELVK
jgi:glycosyltransferase involved in cell wall biosynthesis